MTFTQFLHDLPFPAWVVALLALLASAVLAILLRALLELVALRLTRRGAPAFDVLIKAMRTPVTVLFFLLGVRVSLDLANLSPRYAALPMKGVVILTVFAAAYAIGAGLLALLRQSSVLSTRLAPLSGFLSGVIRATCAFLGFLIALDSIGISITPVLASLGVGSVAVALALQETLGNFFAGISILADHPIRVGEWVRIEPDVEGRVVTIGWRTTEVIDLSENLVILPNATVARATIRNFERPQASEVLAVRLVLEHGSPLDPALDAVRRAVTPWAGTVFVTSIEPAGIELTAYVKVESRATRVAVRSEALHAIAVAFDDVKIHPARALVTAPRPAEHRS
ncbi:MAG: mechanosensitive ion channel domain-containing protein [Thermoanaerobaculia bacterium]